MSDYEAPFIVNANGSSASLLTLWHEQTFDAELRQQVLRVNGDDFYSLILMALPEGADFPELAYADYPDDYIQCAGDASEQMVCEIREDGHQYVLSRAAAEPEEGEVTILWNNSQSVVRPDQALTGEEVADCFVAYMNTGREPDGYTRTEIQI